MTAALRKASERQADAPAQTPAERKRAERKARKLNGEVQVCAWLAPELLYRLEAFRGLNGMTRGNVVELALMRFLK